MAATKTSGRTKRGAKPSTLSSDRSSDHAKHGATTITNPRGQKASGSTSPRANSNEGPSSHNSKASAPTSHFPDSRMGTSERSPSARAIDDAEAIHNAPEPSPSLGDLIKELDTEPSIEHTTIGLLVIERLRADLDGWQIVKPAIDAYVQTHRRIPERRVERQIMGTFKKGDPDLWDNPMKKLSLDQLRAWADRPINFNGRRRAGELTVSEWDEKIAEREVDVAKRMETIGHYQLISQTLRAMHAETIDAALKGA